MQVERPTSGPFISTPDAPHLNLPASIIPLFHAAWLFAAGIALSHFVWLRPAILLIALIPVVLLCGIAAFHAQRIAWFPLAVLWCLLGAWCAEMEPAPAPAPALVTLSDGLLRTVEGTIIDAAPLRNESVANVEESENENPSQRLDLRISSIEVITDTIDQQLSAEGSVRLTARWPAPAGQDNSVLPFACGEQVRAVARLLPPEQYHDPGVWSRTDYLLDQGITSSASVSIDRIERLGLAPGRSLSCRIAALQHAASMRLLALPAAMQRLPAALRLNDDDAIMLAAMTTGDRTFLSHSLRAGFERTGSFHMLVVSGFHLAIVAACFLWLARRLHLPNVPATLLTIALSFAYAVFTGFATPVQRSLWMVALYLLGRLVYRERSPLNVIGFAALCLLVASPRSLFESSLQMTLLAVVAIAGIAVPLLEKTIHPYLLAARDLRTIALDVKLTPPIAQFRVILRMIATRLQCAFSRRIAWRVFPWSMRFALRCVELLVVSCIVELSMTLPMALYFHRITVFALPVNIFILPLLAVLMPAALLTLLTLFVWPSAAFLPAMVAAAFLHCGVGLVHLFGSFAMGDFRIPAPLAWQSAAFCALLAASIVLARGGRGQRRLAWVALALAAGSVVAPRPIDHPRTALLVEAIDVGQGDSLLLITPDGKTMLVDGGGFGGGPRQAAQDFDMGEEVVSPALWARGIRHLDVVALSHAHSDHMGGLPAVLRSFHPTQLWVGNNPPVASYEALLTEAGQLGVAVRSLRTGDTLSLGDANVQVLAPFRDYQPDVEPGNNDSLVLHVAYGATSVLLEGDAEAPIEQAMLGEAGLQSTLLKVGHHGSVTSTQPEFLARVAPQWAVISCGLHNRYGHPRPEVLAELEAAKVRTFSTDIQGAACFQLDGKSVAPDPFCGR
ncbi:MAG TPA: ComEC/Rec2 family competence protein [Terracidiphilus sp.]|nr:ComEC/Rec2 family competence protein [Terracidiphilus sp.]